MSQIETDSIDNTLLSIAIDALAIQVHRNAREKGFWDASQNMGEKLMLVVTELGEALEGLRKDLKDEHLPEYDSFDVEVADAIIRLLDISQFRGVNIGQIINDKMNYNKTRERLHGKKF